MFHVKHRFGPTLVAFLATALIATGCTGSGAPAQGWAQPVKGPGGTLLIQSQVGMLTALAADGSKVAEFQVKGPPTRNFLGQQSQAPTPLYAAPIVDGTTAYVVGYHGRVARLSLDGGVIAEKWGVDLQEQVVATPILRGDRLYVSAENGTLHVLNVANGTITNTTRPTDGRVWGAPAVQGSRLFIGTLDSSEVIAVNADSGATEWKHEGAGATAADLVVQGDLLVLPSFDRTIHALNTATGDEKWQFRGDGWFIGRPAVTDQAIYAASMRGSVYALDRDGKMRWTFSRTGLEFRATPLISGDTLIVASRSGEVIGLNLADGTEKWSRTVDGARFDASGALTDSGVVYTTPDYKLVRIDPANGEIRSSTVPPSGGSSAFPIGRIWRLVLETPLINTIIVLTALLVSSYGLAILAFTVLVKALTFPLTLKSLNSMKAMQEIQPQMQEIQKKYTDPRRRQEETMRLYREAGVNPLGCLGPLVIQMPIFFALYQVVSLTVGATPEAVLNLSGRLYDVPLIQDAIPLATKFLGADLAAHTGYVLAFVVFATTWLQQRISSSRTAATSEQQQSMNSMMLWMMPVMIAYFSMLAPAGLGLYWAASTGIQIILQWVFVGPGDFTWASLIPNSVRDRLGMRQVSTRIDHRRAAPRTAITQRTGAPGGDPTESRNTDAGSGDERKDGRRGNRTGSQSTGTPPRSGRRRRNH